MFVKEYAKFKKNVEKTIWSFFRMTPEEVEQALQQLHAEYDSVYDLDRVAYKNVRPELKNVVMTYKTMNYFYNIYSKLKELEECICNMEVAR